MRTLSAIVATLKQRRKTSVVLAVLVALAVVYFAPLLITHPAQDACTFGTVSNERYRQLLAEAKRRQATNWPSLPWHTNKSTELLNQRVDDLSRGTTSVYERLAAMHAVIRALGGDYRRTERDVDDPFESKNRSGIVSYDYQVDSNGLGFFSPIQRQIRVIGHLVYSDDARRFTHLVRQSQPGNIYFQLSFPSLFDSYIIIPRSKFGESCPRLPDAALAERLSQPEKQ